MMTLVQNIQKREKEIREREREREREKMKNTFMFFMLRYTEEMWEKRDEKGGGSAVCRLWPRSGPSKAQICLSTRHEDEQGRERGEDMSRTDDKNVED